LVPGLGSADTGGFWMKPNNKPMHELCYIVNANMRRDINYRIIVPVREAMVIPLRRGFLFNGGVWDQLHEEFRKNSSDK
jgi:hypothetical protein